MTEIPLNVEPLTKEKEVKPRISEETRERKVLRPKSKGSPKKSTEIKEAQELLAKPLVNEEEREDVYAISNRRGKWTKHLVGQAAWGIPLDKLSTLCVWNFAERNVRMSAPCKKCFKGKTERDGVKGAREWAQEMSI